MIRGKKRANHAATVKRCGVRGLSCWCIAALQAKEGRVSHTFRQLSHSTTIPTRSNPSARCALHADTAPPAYDIHSRLHVDRPRGRLRSRQDLLLRGTEVPEIVSLCIPSNNDELTCLAKTHLKHGRRCIAFAVWLSIGMAGLFACGRIKTVTRLLVSIHTRALCGQLKY